MASYKLSIEAEADLVRIHQYGIRQFGVERADSYVYQLFDAFEQIAQQPELYPRVDNIRQGYRRCPFRSDSIYYRLFDARVEIMAIIGKQDTSGWL